MGNNHNGGHDDNKDDKPFDGRTYLYIRDNLADTGVEPSPSSPPQWLSPDIAVTPPGGSPGDNPVVGVPNDVTITVRNGGGMPAVDVWVDVFVADPTTGWTPALAFPVGGVYIDVAPYSIASANLTWTPIPGPSHRCMLARCSLIVPPDTYANPSVFDVPNDRHVAQRNLNLVEMPKDQKMMSFGFMIVNPMNEPAEFMVRADHVEATPRNIEMLRAAVGCGFAQFGETALRNFALTIGERITPEKTDGMFGVLREPIRDFTPGTAPQQQVQETLRLEPGEGRRAALTIERNFHTRPGDLHIMEIAQIHMKTRRAVGGLWVVIQH
jgi:hypothetical protein